MSAINIGVLISGGGTNLQAIIDHIDARNINGKIQVVISNKETAYGLTRASDAGIESMYIDPRDFASDEDFNLKLIKEFKDRGVELIVLAGFLKVLSKDFIAAYSGKIMNIHPSLIPSFCGKNYYGSKVHEEVLKYGVKYTGATVHFVDEGTDTGPIVLQGIVPVEPDDTVESLQGKVLVVEHEILVKAVKLYCENRISIEGRKVIIDRGIV